MLIPDINLRGQNKMELEKVNLRVTFKNRETNTHIRSLRQLLSSSNGTGSDPLKICVISYVVIFLEATFL